MRVTFKKTLIVTGVLATCLLARASGTILPALPSGKVTGLRVQDGFEVEIEWKAGVLTLVKLKNILGKKCDLNFKGKTISCSLKAGESKNYRF